MLGPADKDTKPTSSSYLADEQQKELKDDRRWFQMEP